MRFLHTSDWHLGRLFHNVHLTDDQAYVLEQFVQIVKDAKVDAVIIAGDIYDRAVPPAAAVELLDEVLARLVLELKVPTHIIAGNHDSPERLGFGGRLLRERGLFISGTLQEGLRTGIVQDKHGPVHLVPIPFAVPEVVRQWSKDSEVIGPEQAMAALVQFARRQVPQGERSVAIAHAFVVGGQESDSERALSVGGSGQVSSTHFEDFDYVALGHLHRPQHIGAEHIRYSGSLLKYSFSEMDHTKSLSIVDMDAQGKVSIEAIELKPKRDVRAVEGSLKEVLEAAPQELRKDDYLLAILTDSNPLLNPMAQLRQVYPNVLHIERPHFGAVTASGLSSTEQRKMTPVALFEAFWSYTHDGQLLGEARRKIFEKALQSGKADDK